MTDKAWWAGLLLGVLLGRYFASDAGPWWPFLPVGVFIGALGVALAVRRGVLTFPAREQA